MIKPKTPNVYPTFGRKDGKKIENYNYHKISSKLAEYGYCTIRISDDWEGADYIAQHNSGSYFLIQQKSRINFNKKYVRKNRRDKIWIAFPEYYGKNYSNPQVFVYNHDKFFDYVTKYLNPGLIATASWIKKGNYGIRRPTSQKYLDALIKLGYLYK